GVCQHDAVLFLVFPVFEFGRDDLLERRPVFVSPRGLLRNYLIDDLAVDERAEARRSERAGWAA
ncbi:MAG: hypothetical protein ABIP39_01960, partial [Polyangiaceae bacterium]